MDAEGVIHHCSAVSGPDGVLFAGIGNSLGVICELAAGDGCFFTFAPGFGPVVGAAAGVVAIIVIFFDLAAGVGRLLIAVVDAIRVVFAALAFLECCPDFAAGMGGPSLTAGFVAA